MFILDLAIILILGFISGFIMEKIKLPKIIGMIIIGILIGPSFLNIISSEMISQSANLRMIALVIILTRSGLSIDYKKLKKAGLSAFLMCFIPAVFEIIGVLVLGPLLLKISIIESLLLGSVLAAVSPAIVVPRMIKIKQEGYGIKKGISDIILTGASLDDIFVIVLFYAFLSLHHSNQIDLNTFIKIPVQIILGVFIGLISGYLISVIFKKVKTNLTSKIIIVFSISLLLVGLEELLKYYFPFSGLVSVIALGMMILIKDNDTACEIENGYKKIWQVFEIILFVLVGISLNFNEALSYGFMPILVIIGALIFRMIGAYVSLIFSDLSKNEKVFVMISYIAKATVQASIGPIALANNLPVGNLVLTVAVLSILISAPIGALLIDKSYQKLLKKEN